MTIQKLKLVYIYTDSTDTTNQYVDVIFTSAKSISCEFADHMSTHSRKSCSIRYGLCQQPFTMNAQGSVVSDSSSTIKINLDTNLNTYCYSINASNGTFTLLMEGDFGMLTKFLYFHILNKLATVIKTIIITLCADYYRH